ncbi:MAG: 50S ribosomal protein L29 [Flavobacteriaceae bacterium]|nr:50S ribosomal protein L29 [Flavobacteriaceae bacterium]MCY4268230.1 50S ribosomal protein L29 [Flavobacteriaceae bacterium]MCY4300055.1 50S ribosomal protein L29 [Flavobacteriaceae bacterium]
MKQSEVVLLDKDQIHEKIDQLTQRQQKLKINKKVNEIENPLQLRMNRRLIARLKTQLRKLQVQNKSQETKENIQS